MYKEIIAASIKDEQAGGRQSFCYFLERAKEQNSSNHRCVSKHGGQTEREAKDTPGIFADTAAELSK
ncbi:hypothetical protein O9992_15105 [Vibrio lentus]|nr:hypothetical protein [Vibrio lentus]